ncbi:glycerol-3-phosphate 1-O-acyltransferase PlsY [Ureaplasma zalophigenitalium]|uniref:Glycerol-3-phosphate acyltransferase n=1 Tax=Ureaplasma zalophigenitalium TaxID=907723 RepID=A0ABT3BNY4_9BACT|nr:glycerol-3-phosphate 1-O-acyltransferase PlsY [Ureaplasma zalophigenitalium]MCV3753931.1 glycerol-3-phosphate 1-O-acyltransferase PlsY [Ureaplasma zalophigenitalium]
MISHIVFAYVFLILIAPLLAYLVGSFNFSLVFSLWWKRKDVRKFNSQNAGATNMSRVFGKKMGILVFLLDAIKPMIVISMAYCALRFGLHDAEVNPWNDFHLNILLHFSGLVCIVGHVYPIYFNFKGGKGVSSFFGWLLIMNPIVAVLYFVIFYITARVKKYVSLAAMVSAGITSLLVIVPGINYTPLYNEHFASYFTDLHLTMINVSYLLLFSVPAACLLIICHRSNIIRLRLGIEKTNRFMIFKKFI